jgi:hypothetical protein
MLFEDLQAFEDVEEVSLVMLNAKIQGCKSHMLACEQIVKVPVWSIDLLIHLNGSVLQSSITDPSWYYCMSHVLERRQT